MKVKRLCKQVKIKKYANKLKMELNGCYRTKVNSKALAIPILIAVIVSTIIKVNAVRRRIANVLELTVVL